MSKVYVVQENNHIDYSDAERFGDLVFLTASELKAVPGSLMNDKILDSIDSGLKGFSSGDYLVLTGNPAAIGYAFHRVASQSDVVNTLSWDKMRGVYKKLTIEVNR